LKEAQFGKRAHKAVVLTLEILACLAVPHPGLTISVAFDLLIIKGLIVKGRELKKSSQNTSMVALY